MPNIKPISDLRNYTEVLNDVAEGDPVFLTKNGRGKYVIVDIAQYDKMQTLLRLMSELEKDYRSCEEKGWLTAEEAEKARKYLYEIKATCKNAGRFYFIQKFYGLTEIEIRPIMIKKAKEKRYVIYETCVGRIAVSLPAGRDNAECIGGDDHRSRKLRRRSVLDNGERRNADYYGNGQNG